MACVLCIWRIMSLRSANEMLKFSDNFHKQQLQEKEKRISELEAECVEIEGKHNKNMEQIREQYQKDKAQDLAQYDKNLNILREEIDKRFESQKNALLEQNKNMLNTDSRKMLDEIFTPIKTKVDEYSKRLDV